MTSRLIRMPEVLAHTGLSKAGVYALMKDSKFPKSISLGPRTVAWIEEEVCEWAQDRALRKEAVQLQEPDNILNAGRKALRISKKFRQQCENGAYPEVPCGMIKPHSQGHGLPEAPGVYFFWTQEGAIAYVGKSINIKNRARLGHPILRKDFLISFVLLDPEDITWAECYYIGLLRPLMNFGYNSEFRRGDPEPVQAGAHVGAPDSLAERMDTV